MSKLYVFGIGGTGSRVLKALTMLLSSGIQGFPASSQRDFLGIEDFYQAPASRLGHEFWLVQGERAETWK